MTRETVQAFIDAVNNHSIPQIIALMSDDHIFIDAYGSQATKEQMCLGWPSYFSCFPDYLIEASYWVVDGNTAGIFGHASGTYQGIYTPDSRHYWRLPAAWRAVVENETIKVWQVFCDSKLPYDAMGLA